MERLLWVVSRYSVYHCTAGSSNADHCDVGGTGRREGEGEGERGGGKGSSRLSEICTLEQNVLVNNVDTRVYSSLTATLTPHTINHHYHHHHHHTTKQFEMVLVIYGLVVVAATVRRDGWVTRYPGCRLLFC